MSAASFRCLDFGDYPLQIDGDRLLAIAVVATILFSAAVSYLLLKLIGAAMGLKNDDQSQQEGLDLVEHGEKGYHELA